MENLEPGVRVSDLPGRLEGRIAGANAAQSTVAGRAIPARLVAPGPSIARQAAEIPPPVLAPTTPTPTTAAPGSEEEHREGSRFLEEEGAQGEIGERSSSERRQTGTAHRDRSRSERGTETPPETPIDPIEGSLGGTRYDGDRQEVLERGGAATSYSRTTTRPGQSSKRGSTEIRRPVVR